MSEPLAHEMEGKSEQPTSLLKYRLKFLGLIAVFISPFIAGWFAFYVFDYRPVSKNYGDLVTPVRPLALPALTDFKDNIAESDFWNKWTFVILMNEGCDDLCQNNLYYLRQMRIALGRDMDRVQNVLLLRDSVSKQLQTFLTDYPKLTVFPKVNANVFNQFELSESTPGATSILYLMDPAGNLMMTYSAINDPPSILSDMRRLLKLSQIG